MRRRGPDLPDVATSNSLEAAVVKSQARKAVLVLLARKGGGDVGVFVTQRSWTIAKTR
jgi:hypothetical protein